MGIYRHIAATTHSSVSIGMSKQGHTSAFRIFSLLTLLIEVLKRSLSLDRTATLEQGTLAIAIYNCIRLLELSANTNYDLDKHISNT